MTLEDAQKEILRLQTENENLKTKNGNLESDNENLKTTHKQELEEKDKTISTLREHNSYLFERVSQSSNEDNSQNKQQENTKSKEESLADLLTKMRG